MQNFNNHEVKEIIMPKIKPSSKLQNPEQENKDKPKNNFINKFFNI